MSAEQRALTVLRAPTTGPVPPGLTPQRWGELVAACRRMDWVANRGVGAPRWVDEHAFAGQTGPDTESDPGAASTARGPAETKGPSRHG